MKTIRDFQDIPPAIDQYILCKSAVICDLDGTLIDSEKTNYSIYRKVCSQIYSSNISQYDWDKYFKGRRPQESFPAFLKANSIEIPYSHSSVTNALKVLKMASVKNSDGMWRFYPGVHKMLDRYREYGIKLALTTSTHSMFLKHILLQNNLVNTFDIVITGEEVEKGKPAPDVYMKALDKLGLHSDKCIVLEDSPAGIESANAAGIETILVDIEIK